MVRLLGDTVTTPSRSAAKMPEAVQNNSSERFLSSKDLFNQIWCKDTLKLIIDSLNVQRPCRLRAEIVSNEPHSKVSDGPLFVLPRDVLGLWSWWVALSQLCTAKRGPHIESRMYEHTWEYTENVNSVFTALPADKHQNCHWKFGSGNGKLKNVVDFLLILQD